MKQQQSLINIMGVEFPERVYNGNRVVTFEEIARLHQIPYDNVKRNFNNLEKKGIMIEREDYYKVSGKCARENISLPENNIKITRLILIPLRGYLMLCKSFSDYLSYKVQKGLIDGYFLLKDMAPEFERLQQELHQLKTQVAQQKLEKYILNSKKFTHRKVVRLVLLKKMAVLSNEELGRIFGVNKGHVSKVLKMYFNATGDFKNRQPLQLQQTLQRKTGERGRHLTGGDHVRDYFKEGGVDNGTK